MHFSRSSFVIADCSLEPVTQAKGELAPLRFRSQTGVRYRTSRSHPDAASGCRHYPGTVSARSSLALGVPCPDVSNRHPSRDITETLIDQKLVELIEPG